MQKNNHVQMELYKLTFFCGLKDERKRTSELEDFLKSNLPTLMKIDSVFMRQNASISNTW